MDCSVPLDRSSHAALDFAFLGSVGKKLFDANVGDMVVSTPRVSPAVLFYLIYLMGIVVLVNGAAPSDWRHNLMYGAVLGFVAYSTFELTNMAMLRIGRGTSSCQTFFGAPW